MTMTEGTWLVFFGFCIGILVGAFIDRLKIWGDGFEK